MEKKFFADIPKECEQLKNQISNEAIKKIYSELSFLYVQFPTQPSTTNDGKNTYSMVYIEVLFQFLINFRFFTFYILNINDPIKQSLTNIETFYFEDNIFLDLKQKSYTQTVNVIITCETVCLIIENIPISLFLLINKKILKLGLSIINVTDDTEENEIKKEISSFYNHFRFLINNNKFVRLTIPSISCYFIRRFYYPTYCFNDPSFFKANEIEIKITFEDIFSSLFTSENDFSTLMKECTNMMKALNQINYEKVNIQDFEIKDFIQLRKLYGNDKSLIYLAIHLKSLHLYAIKISLNQDNKEVNFVQNFSHRCCRKFYGFLKDQEKTIGFVYEFMSNGTLSDFLKNQQIDNTYIIMTIIRLFQGIDYFHSNSLIYRDLKPSNILIDNDYIPYICDFDVIRYLDDSPMTNNIGSPLYTSPEQESSGNISYSSDIYSFGLIIYYLYEKKDLMKYWKKENEEVPLISKASQNIHDIYQSCLQFDPEKRMKNDEIKSKLLKEINQFSYLEDYFIQKETRMKTNVVIQYFIESIFIQIDNEEIINKYYDNLFYYYAPFYFKIKGEYGNLYFAIGKYYSHGNIVKKDVTKAIKYYELSAKYNDSTALLYLGIHYEYGDGVSQDYLKAIEYYELSAKLQNSDALLNLGNLYEKGRGVKQDYKKALEYFEKSAELENSTALFDLGTLYAEGKGVKQDYQKAKYYYELSAEKNNMHALFNLGHLYLEGTGVEKDYSKAFKYFELSAKLKNLSAIINLGNLYENGFGVKQDFQKAKECYEYCAEKNHPQALYNLGVLYEKGHGVEQDYKKAKEYYELSAKENNSQSLCNLGIFYFEGLGVEKDYLKGIEYFEMSAKLNNDVAFLNLGNIYSQRLGIETNFLKAKEYYELSAKQGNSSALLNLGALYEKGQGVRQDYLKAKEYFELSSKKGNVKATINLGNLYEKGHGVAKDYLKARQYYEIAAIKKHPKAFLALGNLYSNGLGVEQNYFKANEYYELSSKQNDTKALINLGYHYEKGLGFKQNKFKAMDFYGKAAMLGDPGGYLNIGFIYSERKEYTIAKAYYELAAKQNNSIALLNLGTFYEQGKGVEQDYLKAKEYYELSAQLKNSSAYLYLGDLYENGKGVEKNYKKAKDYYEIAAQQNNSDAIVSLGTLYEKGLGVDQNITQAVELYESAGMQNNAIAFFFLGTLYSSDEFCDIDLSKAENYFLKCFETQNIEVLTFTPNEGSFTISTLTNFYRNRSLNDLGLLYHTVLQDREKAFEYIKKSAFEDYPFAQNNCGLYYQLYYDNRSKAEERYIRSSSNAFALAEFNLGLMREKENKIQESIDYFMKASNHEDQPLFYRFHNHYDKRLDISKTFILCFTNLKLALYFLTDIQYDKSREYFVKSFAKLNLTNDKITYIFDFHFLKRKTRNIFSYLKNFILQHPLFNLKNQPYSEITNYINALCESQNDKDKHNFKQKSSISKIQSKIIDKINELDINYIKKYKYVFESKFINDWRNNEATNIDPNNNNNNNNGNDEIIFDDPGKLFDFIISDENLKKSFIDEIKEILQILEKILFIPPYPILFGRISIRNPNQKQSINQKFINELFYKGFGYD